MSLRVGVEGRGGRSGKVGNILLFRADLFLCSFTRFFHEANSSMYKTKLCPSNQMRTEDKNVSAFEDAKLSDFKATAATRDDARVGDAIRMDDAFVRDVGWQ